MNAEAWRRVEELYHAALKLPPKERAAFLAQACAGNAELLVEVESLLAHEGKADGLLESPAWDQVAIGQVISHYRITAKLGEGGMGVVWKAHDTALDRPVALKTLPAETDTDSPRRARFLQEARSASALNHPNIVTIHDIFHQDGKTYLVMEFVEGKPLDQLIPKEGMRLNDALKFAIQIASALTAAHKIGIVHRDLKPANVMVTPAGLVKVLDFGLAKLVEPAALSEDDPTRSVRALTEKGIIVGTLNYMSPEQAEGRDVDTRSDIFSFGSLIYEMISGARPFQRESRISTLSAVINEEPRPLASAPPEVAKLISRCLRKDPERRIHHMADVRLALEDVKEEWESAPAATSDKKDRKWLRPTFALLVLVSGATGVYLFRQPPVGELPQLKPAPITSYPGDETDPTLSPDGNQVAFCWNGENRDNADIYVKLVSGGLPLRLTTNPARDHAPAWSPDGGQIAFLRSDRTGGEESLMLISPLGGPERELTRISSNIIDTGLSWTRDSKSIAFADHPSRSETAFSIFQISLATSERRRLTTAPPGSLGDLRMSFSPDGKHLAFARHRHSSIADLYLLHLRAGEEPRRLAMGSLQIQSMAWTPSGDEIMYSSAGAMWRCSLTNPAARPVAQAGIDGAVSDPVISPSGRLVYVRQNADGNIWRLNLGEPGAKPIRVVASTYPDDFPNLSPDASRLVFNSLRSGKSEIWASDSNGANPVQLTFLGGQSHSPKWSPDGKQIAFSSLARDGNRDIYVIDSSGGSLRRITTDPLEEGRPNWSRDGRSIYFYSRASGPLEIWKMPAEGGKAVQITTNGGHSGQESPDGKDLFYSKAPENTNGLFRRPLPGGSETMLIPQSLAGWWAASDQGIYFAEIAARGEFQHPPIPIKFWNYTTRKISNVTVIEKPIHTPSIGLSASRDGKVLVWAQTDQMDSDLMLIENFR